MDLPPRVRPALHPPPHAPSPARPRRYWGALTNSSRLTGNLEAWFVDLDGDRIGAGMTRAVQNFVPHGPALNWTFKDPADTGDNDAIASAVLREQVWVAIVGQSSFPSRPATRSPRYMLPPRDLCVRSSIWAPIPWATPKPCRTQSFFSAWRS